MSVPVVLLDQILALDRSPVVVDQVTVYPTIGILNMGRGTFLKAPLLGADTSYANLYQVQSGQVIFSKLKAFERAVAVVPEEHDNHFVSSEFPTFTSNGGVDTRYLAHAIQSDRFSTQLAQASRGLGARRERVHPRDFLQISIPLPELAEQRAIAARLDLVVQRSSSALNLDAGSQSFGSQLPGMVQRIFTRNRLNSVKASSLYAIVNDLVRPGDDPAPASRFVGLEHIEPHTGRRLGASSVENLNGRKFRFAAGDVLYGYLRPYQNKVWVADGDGLCSVEQFVLRPRPGVDPVVLGWSLRARTTLDAVISGTNNLQLPRLGSRQLGDLEVFDAKAATPQLRARLEETSMAVIKADLLSERRRSALKALPQAARNAEFARLLG